ncbi:bacteriocin ABC transporter ATP-binding protein [Lysinibacillus alkalisoli]|uniref:Bacteriocin ABC transporter ATP-binding protein n=1 Tax=Lysinibacillus alkalisoli TaxID=1911548 RepID=A0A917D4U7_9BACI|nr:ATP-binding cassette domain-containing protein [Lysinibacillus alkalisoli]GGG11013.1 bacteriocin ABC transporter ATP-binding protein [Lysinibacillus alkalisoli]
MIQVEQLYKKFGDKILFDHFNLTIDDGEFIVLSGESGRGKTTLLNIIGAIEPFDAGRIMVDGIDISKKKNQLIYLQQKVGFLFQNFALIDHKTVRQNLQLIKKKSRSETTIEEALQQVGLANKVNQKVYSLSGGEQQRVALARLMMKQCDIIFADEPTGSLDRKNAEQVMQIMQKLNEQGKTIVLVTHDEWIKQYASRVVYLT